MVIKRMSIHRRRRHTWPRGVLDRDKAEMHTENVVRESWWLMGIVPLYVRETTHATF